MTPTFTVLIGSIGRLSLRHTLDSIARQARVPGDQALVAFDSFEQGDQDLEARHALVASYGDGFASVEYDAGYHWFGIEPINHAIRTRRATFGSHVFTLGDDDVFVDDAYATLRPLCAAAPLRPILYRFLAPWREVLWDVPQMQRSRISGCCIAAPGPFVDEFPTRQYVEHDYDWMVSILSAAAIDPLWLDRVLVIARPDVRGAGVAHLGVWQCARCGTVRYLEDLAGATCPTCGATR